MKKTGIFAACIAPLAFFLAGCSGTYYTLQDIPVYPELDDRVFTKAPSYAVYPAAGDSVYPAAEDLKSGKFYLSSGYPSFQTRMLLDAFHAHGYRTYDYTKCLSLQALDQVEHVVQVISLQACRHRVEDGYAVTYRLVVMIRPPIRRGQAGGPVSGKRFFQSYYRICLKKDDPNPGNSHFLRGNSPILEMTHDKDWKNQGKNFFPEEYVKPLFENLFNIPEFRKALQPAALTQVQHTRR